MANELKSREKFLNDFNTPPSQISKNPQIELNNQGAGMEIPTGKNHIFLMLHCEI
jgi:hypothetical protein